MEYFPHYWLLHPPCHPISTICLFSFNISLSLCFPLFPALGWTSCVWLHCSLSFQCYFFHLFTTQFNSFLVNNWVFVWLDKIRLTGYNSFDWIKLSIFGFAASSIFKLLLRLVIAGFEKRLLCSLSQLKLTAEWYIAKFTLLPLSPTFLSPILCLKYFCKTFLVRFSFGGEQLGLGPAKTDKVCIFLYF